MTRKTIYTSYVNNFNFVKINFYLKRIHRKWIHTLHNKGYAYSQILFTLLNQKKRAYIYRNLTENAMKSFGVVVVDAKGTIKIHRTLVMQK